MTVKDTFNSLGDGFRNAYGITDQLTFNQMVEGLNGLNPIYVERDKEGWIYPGSEFDSALLHSGQWSPNFNKMTDAERVSYWNSIFQDKSLYITVSCDVEWEGFTYDQSTWNRVGFEFEIDYASESPNYYGTWLTPTTESGKQHISDTYLVSSKPTTRIGYASYYIEGKFSKIKLTNLKVAINPMGGGKIKSLNLMDDMIGTWYTSSGYTFNQTNTAFIWGTSLKDYGDDDIDIPRNIRALTLVPDNWYKLSFWGRGSNVDIYSFVFPYNSKSHNNSYTDNFQSYQFDYNWQYYEYTFLYDPVTPQDQSFVFRYTRTLPRIPWWAQVSGLSLVQIPNL